MAYGLQLYDASGVLGLAVTDRLTRLIYTRFLPANESSSVVVPAFDAATCAAFAAPRMPALTESSSRAGHVVTTSGTTISWSPGSAAPGFRADSDLLVFAYA